MMKRFFLLFVASAVVLLSVGGCSNVGSRIKAHIETVGTELTGTPVTVEVVDVKPARGAGSIEHLRIANPDGYVAKNAFSVGSLHLNVGLLSTAAGEPLVIDRLVLSYPVLNFEKDGTGGSNLAQLYEQVKERREQADRKSAEIDPGSSDDPSEPMRLKIKELKIEGVTLNVRRENGESRSAILPTIVLEDVGGERGYTPARLGLTVAGAMTGEILKQAIARELIERAGNIKQALSTDNLMALIDYKLHLTPDMMQLVRPVVDDFSSSLTATIDGWIEKGHIDLAELDKQFTPIFEEYRQRLRAILESEAFAALQEQFPEIRNNAVEVLRYLIIMNVAEHLQMTPEQVAQLMPILHDYLRQISDLISELAADPERARDMLATAYGELDEHVRDRLAEHLTEEQMEKFHHLRDELLPRIEQAIERYR